MYVDLLALEPALDEPRDVGVLARQHAVERLEQQHVAAQAREARGDLRARGAGADDGETSRQLGQRPRLLCADHAAAELDAGHRAGDRPCREDHAARAQRALADRHITVAAQARVALDHVDRVFLEQHRDARGERRDDLLAPRLDRRVVDLDAGDPQAELLGVADLAEHVGGAQHRLGGDARVVQAAPAHLVALDHRGLEAELGRPDRGHVAAGSGADHDAVVVLLGHRG